MLIIIIYFLGSRDKFCNLTTSLDCLKFCGGKIHQYPLSAMVLVCWFKAKQNEYETICAAVEAIRLGVGESQAMELIGVTPSKKR